MTSSETLSAALRAATATAHERAETSTFVEDLLAGRSCAGAFTVLAVQQLPIYAALEDILTTHYSDHPLLRAVHDPALARTNALRHDVTTLLTQGYAGPTTPETVTRDVDRLLVDATRDYVQRLREEHDAPMLLAHHYVRYLGDLSGGQVIARLVARHYAVPQEALTFYRFEQIPALKPYKDGYRRALDTISLHDRTRALVLDRAIEAFELSAALFADLGRAMSERHLAAGVAA
ncbi:MAG: biliverdin-producing heme oxygenase [Intrasporangiaceae bacterium]|nr:biliverdin-producing heme oxygenase [Intrasporangiaceae bacterium]